MTPRIGSRLLEEIPSVVQLLRLKAREECPCGSWKPTGRLFCRFCWNRLDPITQRRLRADFGPALSEAYVAALTKLEELR